MDLRGVARCALCGLVAAVAACIGSGVVYFLAVVNNYPSVVNDDFYGIVWTALATVVVVVGALCDIRLRWMTQAERRGCAYHEAGHAIVGKILGRRLSKVEIGIDGDPSKGCTHFDDNQSLSTVDGLALCCAGMASERMFGVLLGGRAVLTDRYRAEKILAPIPVNEWPALKRSGYRRAWRILKANSHDVIDIANRLIKNSVYVSG